MTNDDPIGRIKSAILALPSERRPDCKADEPVYPEAP